MKKAAAYLSLAAGALGFAWAAQAYPTLRYYIAAAIVIGAIYLLFRAPLALTPAGTVAEFDALKREQARLTALQEKARQERWNEAAQASVAKDLAQVEQRLAAYR